MKNLICTIALILLTVITGCAEVVPPGKVAIIVSTDGDNEIYEKGVFKAWGRDRVYMIDGRLASFEEDRMQILCADDINMSIDIKSVLSFKIDKDNVNFIKSKIPAKKSDSGYFEISLNDFYKLGVKSIIRGTARNVISAQTTDDIRPNREKLEAEINEKVKKRLADLNYPLNVQGVIISNIDYPNVVKQMREKIKTVELEEQERAARAQAELAEAQRRVEVETEKAKVVLVQAQAKADENEILSESLTERFLMWRQLEVMQNIATDLSQSQNNTVFMMPYQMMDQQMFNSAMMKNAVDQMKPQ